MSEHLLRLVFAGTPDLAAVALEKILNTDGFAVESVLTQPDRPAGRGRKLKPGPVKILAQKHNLPILQPETKTELDPENHLCSVDILVVAAYGMLIPEEILNRPKYGCLNIHTSLLPRWRGAAPIQRAIEAGDEYSGVSIMQMEPGLDTGPVLLQKSCRIETSETASSLHNKLSELGADAIVETMKQLPLATLKPRAQDDKFACYANKIYKAEAEIDWQRPSLIIERKIRAFNPSPVCFTNINDQDMRIWEALPLGTNHQVEPGSIINCNNDGIEIACSEGSLLITTIQIPGKKPVSTREFLNGRPDFPD